MPMQVDDTGSDPKPEPAAPRGASGGACLAAAELPFVDNYLPALLAQASELISGEFHLVVRAHEQRVLEPFGLQQAEALKATLRGMIDARRPKG